MKRPIKFRGRVPEGYHHYGGQTVCGSLVMYREDDYWAQGYPNWIVPFDERRAYPVDEDSVAQLVGYDRDGREVYEGDTVIRYDDENEFVECPENGKLRTVIFYTQVVPDLNDYYCLLKEAQS